MMFKNLKIGFTMSDNNTETKNEKKIANALIELETLITDKGLKDTGITIQIALFAIASLIWLLLKTIKINNDSLNAIYLLFLFILSFTTTIAILVPDFKHGFIFKYKKWFKFTFTRKSTSYNAAKFFYNPLALLLYAVFYSALLYFSITNKYFINDELVFVSVFLYLFVSLSSVILIMCYKNFKNYYFKSFRYYIFTLSFLCCALTGYLIFKHKGDILQFGEKIHYIQTALIITVIVFLIHYLFNVMAKRQMLDNLLLIKKLLLIGRYKEEWVISKIKETALSDDGIIKISLDYINGSPFTFQFDKKILEGYLEYMKQNKYKIKTDAEVRKTFSINFSHVMQAHYILVATDKNISKCKKELNFLLFNMSFKPISHTISIQYDYKYNETYIKELLSQLRNKEIELEVTLYIEIINLMIKSVLEAIGYDVNANKNLSFDIRRALLSDFLKYGTFNVNQLERLNSYKEKIKNLFNKYKNKGSAVQYYNEYRNLVQDLYYYVKNDISNDLVKHLSYTGIYGDDDDLEIRPTSQKIEERLKVILSAIDRIINDPIMIEPL